MDEFDTAKSYYWNALAQTGFSVHYYAQYGEKSRYINSWLTKAPAVVSLIAICLWTMLPDQANIWAFAILAAQIVAGTSTYLPYAERGNSEKWLSSELETLYIEMVNYFYDILQCKNNVSAEAIFSQTTLYEKQRLEILQQHSATTLYPDNVKLIKSASDAAETASMYRFKLANAYGDSND